MDFFSMVMTAKLLLFYHNASNLRFLGRATMLPQDPRATENRAVYFKFEMELEYCS
jgi:hypothetical protein